MSYKFIKEIVLKETLFYILVQNPHGFPHHFDRKKSVIPEIVNPNRSIHHCPANL